MYLATVGRTAVSTGATALLRLLRTVPVAALIPAPRAPDDDRDDRRHHDHRDRPENERFDSDLFDTDEFAVHDLSATDHAVDSVDREVRSSC